MAQDSVETRLAALEATVVSLQDAITALHGYAMAVFERLSNDLPGTPLEPQFIEGTDDKGNTLKMMIVTHDPYPQPRDDPAHAAYDTAVGSMPSRAEG